MQTGSSPLPAEAAQPARPFRRSVFAMPGGEDSPQELGEPRVRALGPIRRWVSGSLFGAALVVLGVVAVCPEARAQDLTPEATEIFGEIELEGTGFFRDPQFPGQDRDSLSVAGQVTLLAEWMDGDVVARFTPFGRYDIADDRRSRWDIREAKLDLTLGDWSVTAGADTVFWGKTEAVHLVDIINQTDSAEAIDDEARLGQPMLRVGYLSEIGEFSAFYLPYFRERRFPGVSGRLRTQPVVNTALPLYDRGTEEWTPSFALRYAGVIGDVDLGLSAFHGVSRDPAFFFDGVNLRPFYEVISQGGVEAQYTSGATLWKLEGIYRSGQRDGRFLERNFGAATGGLEHTLFGILDSNADLGLIAEYAWDSRGGNALTSFQNDLILGTRLALNDEEDTAILLTGAVDMDDGSVGLRLEADRRIAEDWTVALEGQAFLGLDRATPAGAFADDSFLRLKLTYFFGDG